MQTVHVELGVRSYPIYIGEKLFANSQLLRAHTRAQQVLIVTNETVAPLYLQQIRECFAGLSVSQVVLPDGEAYKTLAVLSTIYDQLLQEKHNRTTTLVALGGGVVGDMTGFAAASYQRGVDFIQIPTTLLSQVDSSVGGKTGVNHPLGKNMIGAFYQPKCVLADTGTLETLPKRELSAGIAEVIKYGLIVDGSFFNWLDDNVEKLLANEREATSYAIQRSCENKAMVVAQDERESGVRAILNLGHTFGHAIETAQGYGNWLHGEAVAVGMLMAVRMSQMMGHLTQSDYERVCQLIHRAGLPVDSPKNMTGEQFINLMGVDKKVIDGKLRLVLLERIGQAVVSTDFDTESLHQVLNEYCSAA